MALDPHSINSKEATIAERRLPAAETLLPPSHQMYSTALSARAVEKLSEVALLIGLEISLTAARRRASQISWHEGPLF